MKDKRKESGRQSRDLFLTLVSPHLKWLEHLTGHLIRYFESMGEIVEDDIAPREVVDSVLIQAYDDFLEGRIPLDVRSGLTRTAIERLDVEINRLVSDRRRTPVHLEDDIPETPQREWVTRLGEEILYFYQPDEDLRVEDVIADPESSNPEEQLAEKETRECVQASLREMPEDWRNVMLWMYGEDEPIGKVAQSLGKTEEEVRRIIQYSRRYLRQRLVEAGCVIGREVGLHDQIFQEDLWTTY